MKPDITENLFDAWKKSNERWAKFTEDLNNDWSNFSFWSGIVMYILGFCTCVIFFLLRL